MDLTEGAFARIVDGPFKGSRALVKALPEDNDQIALAVVPRWITPRRGHGADSLSRGWWTFGSYWLMRKNLEVE